MNQEQDIRFVMGAREWLLIVSLSVIWGASFFFVEVAVAEITPLTLVLYRVGLAAVVLWGYIVASGRQVPKSMGFWSALGVMGLLNNVLPFSLIAWGQTRIDSGLASILNAFSPVFSVLLAHFLTKEEPLTPNRLFGVLLGWAGVGMLMGFSSLKGDLGAVAGQGAVLAASFLYACAAVFGRRFKGVDPMVTAAGMLTCSFLIMLPPTFILEEPFGLSPGFWTWGAMAGLAVVSTAMGYIIYFTVLARAGATNILLVTFLLPISAIFLGVVILGESLEWNAFAGMAMIFAGLLTIDGRVFDWIQKG